MSIESVEKVPSLVRLFLSFLKLGATAFGGPAMIAYIRRMVVEHKKWMDDASFRDGVAFCQMVPGATAMQSAAYVGLRVRGVSGAAASFIGFGLPAFLVMMILSALYVQTRNLPVVISAFNGLQAMIVSIVANAAITFGRTSMKTWKAAAIAIVAGILFGFGVNPFLVILLAAIAGIVLYIKQPNPPVVIASKRITTTRPTLIIIAAVILGFVILFFANPGLFNLAALMVRVDLFAFGGGFTSVPLMFNEVVNVNSWMDSPTFLNGIALGQVTPGPIVITATFIGFLLYGPFGGTIATLAVFMPSFLIVVGIAPYFDKLRAFSYFNKAVSGILSSFVGLLVAVTVLFALKVPWDFIRALIAIATFVALWFKVEVYWVVIAGIAISIFFL
ncbi:MAG: chromate efflux transporter [Chloroflexi bacterium]|nr:chromate efflux transporter [Chloroflexota bacterium]